MSTITPVGQRFGSELSELATLTDPERPGWTRRALSEFDIAGRDYATLRQQRDAQLVAVLKAIEETRQSFANAPDNA